MGSYHVPTPSCENFNQLLENRPGITFCVTGASESMCLTRGCNRGDFSQFHKKMTIKYLQVNLGHFTTFSEKLVRVIYIYTPDRRTVKY